MNARIRTGAIALAALWLTLGMPGLVSASEPMIEVVEQGDARTAVIPVRIVRDSQGQVVEAQVLESSEDLPVNGTFYAGFGAPQGFFTTLGVIIGPIAGAGTPLGGAILNHGLLLEVSPGANAGQVSAGYAVRGGVALIPVFLFVGAIDLKATVLQTWGAGTAIEPGQTFVGPQFDLNLYLLKASVGALRRIAGSQPGYDWLMTSSIALGF